MDTYPITVSFPVHWGEMDALGHVNHTRYAVWMETARIILFERIGLVASGQSDVGPILANLNINYRAPVQYPATCECGVRISRIGNRSFTMEYAVVEAKDKTRVVADATSVVVLYNYREETTVKISDDMKAAMEAL